MEREISGQGLVQIVNHGGVSRGGQGWLMILPDYQMAVAVNINRKTEVFWDFGSVSLEIASEFIHALPATGCQSQFARTDD